jgi:hypothetical protein
MVVVELLDIKTHSPAITKLPLLADINAKRTPTSLSGCLNSLAISLSGLPCVLRLFLVMDTSELCPVPLC